MHVLAHHKYSSIEVFMAVSHTLVTPRQVPSALAALQERGIRGDQLSEHDIVEAIRVDIEAGAVVSEVFLSKFVAANTAVSPVAIESLLGQLQIEMNAVLLGNPDLFVCHAKAAAFLARELRRRRSVLHLV